MFEIRDHSEARLATAERRAEAEGILRAFVATAPGREDEIFLVALGADGTSETREDIFDL